jgi:hypothetical protein
MDGSSSSPSIDLVFAKVQTLCRLPKTIKKEISQKLDPNPTIALGLIGCSAQRFAGTAKTSQILTPSKTSNSFLE